MAKKLVTTYTFDKTAKTVTFTNYTTISLKSLLLITNVTRNIIVYNFADTTRGGTVLNNVLALAYDTSSMSNSDELQIFYDDGIDVMPSEVFVGELSSPFDFTVSYTTGTQLTCYGAPITIDDSNCTIMYIQVKNSSGIWTKYMSGVNNVNITCTSNIITMTGAGTSPFLNTDLLYRVVVASQRKGYDPTLDVYKTSEISPVWNRYTDPEGLVTSAQNVTASWADLGAEIDVRGYTRLIAWITITHNASVNNRIKALAKHTYAGADEYELPIRSTDVSVVKVLPMYYEFDSDTTQKMVLDWDVTSVQYVQLQVQCETVGATADTFLATITKMYQ